MPRTPARLGCLTGTGIIASLITLAAVTIVALASGNRIFSPGELNAFSNGKVLGGVANHAELAERCAECHPSPLPGDDMQGRCLTCHTEIALERSQGGSLHASFEASLACQSCHSEHRGANAPRTDFNLVRFPHESVGYSLRAHAGLPRRQDFTCQSCHPDSVRTFDEARCRACHLKVNKEALVEHMQVFGPVCLNCHDGVDQYGSRQFSHRRTDYPLEGRHADAACEACHQSAGTIAELRSTPQACAACHASRDVHEGRLGKACGDCHVPLDWAEASIDHDLTAFPLEQAHLSLSCDGCHVAGQLTGVATDCYACHSEDDAHGGRYGARCEACHQATVWEDAIFDHALSRFALTGAHAQVDCESCHAAGTFAGLATWCSGCHADPAYHRGLFSASCDACHSTVSWRPAPYNGAHRFPYNHGERGNSCATCHPNALTSYTCYGCHKHNADKIARKHREEGISNFSNCIRCHPTGREEEGGDD